MSYCRFIEADAYIYDDVDYRLYCCACSLMPTRTKYNTFLEKDITMHESFIAGRDYNKMLAHIAEHRAAGDYIPERVDERLIFERDCEHVFVNMDDYRRCEKCWEIEYEH